MSITDPVRSLPGLIAKSPFRPLSDHAEKVRLTVWKMSDAVNAYAEGDTAKVEALYGEISSLEHDADGVKHAIRQHLPSTNIMPVDRTDMLSYLKQQDDVANSAEMVAQDVTKLGAMKAIYGHEEELGPTVVYHLLMLVREMGWVAEHAESSSNRLRLMIARK
ncbi:MAG TPA: DUF47 family protein [Methanocella sp.]|nr:DUF47 family protein [Methanocella sp.]